MKITWLGHSSFMLEDGSVTLITDPYDETVGYSQPGQKADIVVSSHDHFDHNYFEGVKGDFEIFNAPGKKEIRGITITGVATFHDGEEGGARGQNVVSVIEMGGLRICHLGDLGHKLSDDQALQIGKVDVLLTPVGGFFTIDAQEAAETAKQLNADIVVPMHFKNDACTWDIGTEKPFVELLKDEYSTEYSDKSWFEPKKGDRKLIVLKHRF
ncbi:MAG: MBL fold metallo-hydrolase [Christensenellales bacterium]